MNNNIHYVKIKRDAHGICNICKKETELSWDHVPPKGSIFYTDVEIYSLSNGFLSIDNPPRVVSQNGMKFRTICSSCNNLMGTRYDVVFNNFIKQTILILEQGNQDFQYLELKVDLKYLVMSILGHLLAAKAEYEATVPDEMMRNILNSEVFDSNGPLNIHYWFYPYASNQVARDLLVSKINLDKHALVSILKVFPFAFLVTESDMFIGKVPRLNEFYHRGLINFNVSLIPDFYWPIIVDDETVIMGAQSIASSVIAVPRIIKK